MAVNQEYADAAVMLSAGDELALIPPVSGGSVDQLHTRVTDEPLSLDALVERVRDPRAGAVVTFLGVTREVDELDYEAYVEMAERKIAEIVAGGGHTARPVRRGRRAPGRHRAAVRAVGGDRCLRSAPGRGVPWSPGDHRRDQGAGADLEEGGGRVGAGDDTQTASAAERLRALPAVHELASGLSAPHRLAVTVARAAIDEAREQILAGAEPAVDVHARARELLLAAEQPSLVRVLNATGVIIHTNLGRAPLCTAARDAINRAGTGYSNLELDLGSGGRGTRHAHVERLLVELTGAEAAIAVGNGAGAVLLAAAALGGPGSRIVVSRGQLVEIGGGFRIPDVIATSGATLIEVGTTNRTRLADYERALQQSDGRPTAILRVHPSNFRSLGFVEEVPIEALCGLGAPVIDDVGSGVIIHEHGIPALADEPAVSHSVAAGAALVCCSGDKLLGGPQAGILVGRADAIAAARSHPLARALRIDKLSLAALEATLALYRDPARARREIPVLAMLDVASEILAARAQRLREGIGSERCEIVASVARVGGGALPLLELPGPAVALYATSAPAEVMAALRAGDPPLIARVHEDRVLLDPRTLAEDEVQPAIAAVRSALDG